MFHDQLLNNVEHTLNLLEFCVLVDFRTSTHNSAQDGWRLSSTKSWTFPISIHLFCMLPLRMLRFCGHSQLLPQKLKDLAHVLMVRVFHVFQFWWWRSKFPCAIGVKTFCLITVLPHQFPGCHWNILLSTRLRISDFWIWVGLHQFPGC